MRRLAGAFAVLCIAILADYAEAASLYTGSARASLSVAASGADGLDSLLYSGSNVSYSASAVAVSDGTAVVDSAVETVMKGAGEVSFGSFFGDGGKLGDLLLVPSSGPVLFDNVHAAIDGAEAEGENETHSPGDVVQLFADVNGKASDEVEFAASNVRWDLLIAFQNISSEALNVSWTVAYLLSNSAMADPHGTAASVASVKVQRGSVCEGVLCPDSTVFEAGNAACDPATSDCSFGPSPPSINETKIFNFAVLPNEIRYINIEVLARGSATVVPLPAAFPLFAGGLGLLALLGWRTKRGRWRKASV